MLYWFLKWIALGPVLRLVFRPKAFGIDNVPEEGPAILASNHLSYADWLFMPLTLNRRVTFVAKAEYFTTPGVKGWFQKKFFSGAGQVPIDRSGANAAEGAMKSAMKILAEGDLFGIYPEGTRSHDGRLYRGKTGVARLALETGAPVIPCAVVGTDVVAPAGKVYGSWTRPVVRFGKPLDFSRYEGMENDRYILRSITDEIMYEIMRLSGQEYVDMYASKAKERPRSSTRRRPSRLLRSRPLATRPTTGRSRRRPDTDPLRPCTRGRLRARRRGPALPGARHRARRRDRQHGRPQRLPPRQLRPPDRSAWRWWSPWSSGPASPSGSTTAAPRRTTALLVADLAIARGRDGVTPLAEGRRLQRHASRASG